MPNINWTEGTGTTRTYGVRYGSGGGTTNNDGTGYLKRSSRVRVGGKLPLSTFLTLQKGGVVPSNSLTDHSRYCASPVDLRSRPLAGVWYGLDGKPTSAMSYALGPYGLYFDGNPPGLDTSAAVVLSIRSGSAQKAKLEAINMELNVGQFVAEFSQTRDLVCDAARLIARAALDVKRGRLDSALRTLTNASTRKHKRAPTLQDTFAKRWLALQYGVLPLISDVYGACETLANHMVGRPIRFTARGTESTSVSYTGGSSVYDYPSPLLGTEVRSTQIRATTGYLCEVTNSTLQSISKMGLDNPALLAWELLPFSFVVDWFFKVGDFLEASCAFRGVTVRDKWQTLLMTQNGSVTYKPTATGTTGGTGTTVYSQRYFNRSTQPHDPPFNIQKGSGFNLTRVGNSLALLQCVFGGSVPRRTIKV